MSLKGWQKRFLSVGVSHKFRKRPKRSSSLHCSHFHFHWPTPTGNAFAPVSMASSITRQMLGGANKLLSAPRSRLETGTSTLFISFSWQMVTVSPTYRRYVKGLPLNTNMHTAFLFFPWIEEPQYLPDASGVIIRSVWPSKYPNVRFHYPFLSTEAYEISLFYKPQA